MMKVALIDDGRNVLKNFCKHLNEAYKSVEFSYYENYGDFLKSNASFFSLFIVCIHNEDMNEIKSVIKHAPHIFSMFVVSNQILPKTLYHFKPYRFIKEVDLDYYFFEILDSCLKACINNNKYLILPIHEEYVKISLDEIEYIYSEDNYTYIKTDELKKYRIPLKDIKGKIVRSSFCCVCSSMYVNVTKIKRIDTKNEALYFENNAHIHYSRRHKKELLSLFHNLNLANNL